MVGEQAAAVVLQHGIHDAVEGHDDAQRNEDLHAREPAAEGVNSRLGGEGAHEHRPVEGGLAVSVRQPRVQRRHGGVEDEAGHDEINGGGRVVDVQLVEGPAVARRIAMEHDAGQQQHATGNVHEQIAVSRAQRFTPAPEPDQEHRGERHQLPEQEQGDEVARIDAADGPGDIEPGGDVLGVVLDVQAVKRAQDAHQAHDVAEDRAERIHAAKDECPVEEMHLAEFPAGHGQDAGKEQDGDEQQVTLLQARGHQGQHEGAQDQDQCGMEPEAIHGGPPSECARPRARQSYDLPGALECSEAPTLADVAAPEDGRTPAPVFVIVLAGHDAEVPEPFGKEDDHDAADEAEYGPERASVRVPCARVPYPQRPGWHPARPPARARRRRSRSRPLAGRAGTG